MRKLVWLLILLIVVVACGKKNIEKKVEALIKSKDFEYAIQLLDEKIKEEPTKELYRILKIKVYSRSGNVDLAFKEYEKYYLITGKINKELLKELGVSPLRASVSPYKFMVLLTLADFKKVSEDLKKLALEALHDGDETVRVGACWFVGRQKIKEAEDELIKLTADGRNVVVWNSVWALGEIQSEKGKNVLLSIIDTAKDPSVITETVTALGKYKDKRALVKLRKYINHPGKHISTATLSAVEYIEKGSIKDTIDYLKSRNEQDILAFAYLLVSEYKQKNLMPYVVNALKDKEFKSKENLIRAIGELGSEKEFEFIKPFINSNIQSERVHAYFSAFKLGIKDYEIFKKGLNDSAVEVRRISAVALGQRRNKDIEKIMHDMLLKAPTLDKIYLSLALIQ
jgi:HEAT repeat protein